MTLDDIPTSQSNAIVSTKFTFTFPGASRHGFCTYVHGAKPNPHELVMLRREGLLSAEFFLADIRRERFEKDGFCSAIVAIAFAKNAPHADHCSASAHMASQICASHSCTDPFLCAAFSTYKRVITDVAIFPVRGRRRKCADARR
jgi:hypothetical protein